MNFSKHSVSPCVTRRKICLSYVLLYYGRKWSSSFFMATLKISTPSATSLLAFGKLSLVFLFLLRATILLFFVLWILCQLLQSKFLKTVSIFPISIQHCLHLNQIYPAVVADSSSCVASGNPKENHQVKWNLNFFYAIKHYCSLKV